MCPEGVVDVSETNARFLRRLSSELGASDLSRCFQCGVYVGSYPVREIEVGSAR